MMVHRFRMICRGEHGFTLIELLVAIAIVGLISAGIAAVISQIITGNTRTSNHMVAVRQVQQAGKEVSQDTLQAQNVTQGDQSGFPLTFEWGEWDSDLRHEIVYTLEDMPGGAGDLAQLRRTHTVFNGEQQETQTSRVIARYIVREETVCQLVDPRNLHLTITASVGGGPFEGRETREYRAKRRPD